MASPEEQMRDLIAKIGQKPDSVNYKWGAFELHYYGREGKGDGEARARRTLSNLHGYLRRTGIDTHAAYVQPIDPRDPSRGSMIIVQASAFDKFSRPGAKDMMAATPHKITLKDKSGVTQTWMVSDKILRDMNATKKYAEATGAKPDYSSVLRLGVRMGEVVLASRPGAPDTFAVEDRFYFGKGRKER